MMTRAKTLAATVLAVAVIGCAGGATTPGSAPGSTASSATSTAQLSGYVPYEPIIFDPSAVPPSTALSCSPAAPASTTTTAQTTPTTTTTTQPTALSVDAPRTGIFSVSMVDAPNPDVKEIWVTVLAVSYHVAGQGWVELSDFRPTGQPVDLLKLQKSAMALGFASLPAGTTITQIRLLIHTDVSTGPGVGAEVINKVMVDEGGPEYVPYPLKTPSGYESGVKIMGPWTIQGCERTEVTIDFDGKQSIWYHPTGRETPNGTEWILRPVIRVKGVITGPTDCSVPGTGGTITPPPITPPLVPTIPTPPIDSTGSSGATGSSGTTGSGGTTGSTGAGTVPDGGTCAAPSECMSGSCVGNTCAATGVTGATGSSGGTGSGGAVASGTVPNGGSCSAPTECSSGTCTGGFCVAPAGSVTAGGSCTMGAECSSGTCVGSKCSASGTGTTCIAPAECLSNVCYQNTCSASGVGGMCNKPGDCTTGLCDAATGTCVSPPALPVGSSCSLPTECVTNLCNAAAGAATLSCQPGGQGAACYSTPDCTTGMYCDTSACTVSGTGTCQPIPVHMAQ